MQRLATSLITDILCGHLGILGISFLRNMFLLISLKTLLLQVLAYPSKSLIGSWCTLTSGLLHTNTSQSEMDDNLNESFNIKHSEIN